MKAHFFTASSASVFCFVLVLEFVRQYFFGIVDGFLDGGGIDGIGFVFVLAFQHQLDFAHASRNPGR